MSDPTYRIDVEHWPFAEYPWKAHVTRLSDELEVSSWVGETRDAALVQAQTFVRGLRVQEHPSTVYVDDDGRPVEAHSVKAEMPVRTYAIRDGVLDPASLEES